MPGRMVVDDDEQIIANLLKQMRRLRARLATGQVRGTHDQFAAAATPETTYTLTYIPVDGTCAMYVNGLEQTEGTDYTVDYSTAIVTFVTALTTGDQVDFRYLITDWLVARSLPPDVGDPTDLWSFENGNGLTLRYTFATGTWAASATYTAWPSTTSGGGVHDFAAGAINGVAYLAGGYSATGVVSVQTWSYVPTSDTWTRLADMPTGTKSMAHAVSGGKLYLFGGNQAPTAVLKTQIYNPATDSWSYGTDVPFASGWERCRAVTLSDGRIVVHGGITNGATQGGATRIYTPSTDTWSAALAAAPTHVRDHAIGVINDIVYVIGGWTSSAVTNVQVYNPGTDSWSAGTAMPVGLDETAFATANGLIYVHGGSTNDANSGKVATLYSFDGSSWTTLTSSPIGSTVYQHTMVATA